MDGLKTKIASALGTKLKEALTSDVKFVKNTIPFLIDAAESSAQRELKKHESNEYEFKWGTWEKR